MLDNEALALMALGFRVCFFGELYCKDHGTIRLALAQEPTDRLSCPLCNRSSACGFLFCPGCTRRPLPFHELIDGPLTANHPLPAADGPRPPAPPVLEENEREAIDALRQGSAAGVVSETYQIPAHRYLYKLPGFQKKVRVGFDWLLDAVFSKDVVQFRTSRIVDLQRQLASGRGEAANRTTEPAA